MSYVAEKVDRALRKVTGDDGSREGSAISRGMRNIASARGTQTEKKPPITTI